MQPIRAIIIDDEKDSIELLKIELNTNFPEVEIIDHALGAKDGLLKIATLKPDLIFLDIEMPWMNGLELIKVIPSNDIDIIFVTAYNDLAIKAIRSSALDFLTKPVDTKELEQALQTYKEKKNRVSNADQLSFLLNQIDDYKNDSVRQIALPTQKGISFITLDQILYCKADDIYTELYLEGNKKVFIFKSLKEIEELLDERRFYRCHKSYIVNLKKIEVYVKKDGGYLLIKNNDKVLLSRSKKEEFIKLMEKA